MDILISSGWTQLLAILLASLIVATATLVCVGFVIERCLSIRRVFAISLATGQRARELCNTVMFQRVAALAFTSFIGADLMRWASDWTAGLTTFSPVGSASRSITC